MQLFFEARFVIIYIYIPPKRQEGFLTVKFTARSGIGKIIRNINIHISKVLVAGNW